MINQLSVIIPTLNEEDQLEQTIAALQYPGVREVIIADGGSTDSTLQIAARQGCRINNCPTRGRGRQLNMGVATATGTQLLFLHADTRPPPGFPALIGAALARPQVVLGAFSLAIHPASPTLKAIARLANLRSRYLSLPYGDQGLFINRNRFLSAGGFAEMEIMEDYVFVRKMRKFGKIITLPEKARTSARRWHNLGPLRTTLINQLMVCGYVCRVPAATLSQWYQRLRGLGYQSEEESLR